MSMIEKISSTPCYIIDEGLLTKNLKILYGVKSRADCKILLALKGFSMFGVFPLIREYLDGTSVSSIDEARLGFEEFNDNVHVCAPAFKEKDFEELLKFSSHIVFNSFSQWELFRGSAAKKRSGIKCGLRINPEHSEVKTAIYDPCARFSRLGIKYSDMHGKDLEGITGIHFHNLCELNSDSLERTLEVVNNKFSDILEKMEWINLGGGHHITRKDYDIDKLCGLIDALKNRYGTDVYLEPGEAIALNTGFLAASVLDIVRNEMDIAILDTSAAAHMPDVLEMPYRPGVIGSGEAGEYPYTYRLSGLTCLAGDVIGDYSFKEPLEVGTKLIFTDMAHYTMVKNNTFNGARLPSIMIYHPEEDEMEVVREFGYEDYKNRLS
ncbi:MAG: carboxynorspermidine decarboxylase [Candidatus Omnitrophota bacterium]